MISLRAAAVDVLPVIAGLSPIAYLTDHSTADILICFAWLKVGVREQPIACHIQVSQRNCRCEIAANFRFDSLIINREHEITCLRSHRIRRNFFYCLV